MTLVPRILDLLRENGAEDVLVVVGGTIPTEDVDELKALGVAEVFTPGAPTSEIVEYLRGRRSRRAVSAPAPVPRAGQRSTILSTLSALGTPVSASSVGRAGERPARRRFCLAAGHRRASSRCRRRRRHVQGHRPSRPSSPSGGTATPAACPPSASSSRVVGRHDRPCSISVNAPPDDGAANRRRVAFFRYGNGSIAAPSFGCTSKWRWDAIPFASPESPTKRDRLAGGHARAVFHPGRSSEPGDAGAAIVVRGRQVVVQMDVEVRRPAVAVEVEHAAGARGGRPELDRPRLGRDRRRALRRHQVVALVAAPAARVAEVVGVLVGRRSGRSGTELRRLPVPAVAATAVARARTRRGGGGAPPGCRPVAPKSRKLRFAPPTGYRPLARVSARPFARDATPDTGGPPRLLRRRIESRAMKIAVCVKPVPDAATGRRIDPSSKRLDRSGEGCAEGLRHATRSKRR